MIESFVYVVFLLKVKFVRCVFVFDSEFDEFEEFLEEVFM